MKVDYGILRKCWQLQNFKTQVWDENNMVESVLSKASLKNKKVFWKNVRNNFVSAAIKYATHLLDDFITSALFGEYSIEISKLDGNSALPLFHLALSSQSAHFLVACCAMNVLIRFSQAFLDRLLFLCFGESHFRVYFEILCATILRTWSYQLNWIILYNLLLGFFESPVTLIELRLNIVCNWRYKMNYTHGTLPKDY